MKTIILSALMLIPFLGQAQLLASNEITGDTETNAIIAWSMQNHDFGTLTQGDVATVDFDFTNKGETPLIISQVKTSCGCTASDYPKDFVKTGEEAKVTVTYDTKRKGVFTKSVFVYTNANEEPIKLIIKGEVI